MEIKEDIERPRADIKALNIKLSLHPINTDLLNDLKLVKVDTNDLIGHKVTITKTDYSQPK